MSRKLRVMLVDDEHLVREHLKRVINWEDVGCHIVKEAENGQEAIEWLSSNNKMPDIIVMDICMPILDGIEAAKMIKAMTNQCYILILTGHDEFDYAKRSIKVGVFDYLSKPINRQEILCALHEVKEDMDRAKSLEEALVQRTLNKERDEEVVARRYSDTIEEVLNIIESHIDSSDLSLTSIADKLYINTSHLSRKFKKEVGENFNVYLIERRIKKAMALMKTTNLKNYEIASEVGIEDPNYLSYAFKNT